MPSFYPLYVGACLYEQSQTVGVKQLDVYDTGNGGWGSCVLVDDVFTFRDLNGDVATLDLTASYLQTTDPGVSGRLWNDNGTAKFSTGAATNGTPIGLLLTLTRVA